MQAENCQRDFLARRAVLGFACATALAVTAGCGGGGGGGDTAPITPVVQSGPGGLYVGYYAEDPQTNPEDPTLGVLYLALPSGDAFFSGAMYFTYVGCQTSNVGAISGTRSGNSLTGTWNGNLDGLAQSGNYAASYTSANAGFTGTYSVAGGKQFHDVPGCIQYFIAPNGNFELFAVGASIPSSFILNVNGSQVQWNNPPNTALTLVAVIDEEQALAGQSTANRFQTVNSQGLQSFNLSSVPGLTPGRRYVVTVAAVTPQGQRLATGSAVVTR